MTTRFSGTIRTSEIQAVPKIWSASHDTGHYTSGTKTLSSKVALWVPVPRNGQHLPGIFFRLSNPSGSAYARLDLDEFSEFYSFLRQTLPAAQAAFNESKQQIINYRSLEIEAFNSKYSENIDNIEEKQ